MIERLRNYAIPNYEPRFQYSNVSLLDLDTVSPTARTLKKLRAEGWACDIVERWIGHACIRRDLFGFADVLAITKDQTLAVQCTTAANLSARLDKIRNSEQAKLWETPDHRRIEVHAWGIRGSTGQRKTWQCNVIPVEF